MITYNRSDLIHWNYYIALENDLEKISRYIEFSEKNEKTYSIELAKLLMSASSEVDVVLKMLCDLRNVSAKNIDQYRECIKKNYPDLINEIIYLNRFTMRTKPWENWSFNKNSNPGWWKSYNHVKHERNINYEEANLKNTINSIGALLIILVYYYKEKENLSFKDTTRLLNPQSSLILLTEKYYDQVLLT